MNNSLNYLIKKITLLVCITGFIAFLGCSDDDDPSPILTADQAASKALSIISGTVTSNVKDTTLTGEIVWEATVQTSGGGIVELIFFEQGGGLRRISSEIGPFDYELNPGMSLILFSVARSTALEEIAGEIESWKLDQNTAGTWIYEIEIVFNGQVDRVRIDATTGLVI